MIKIDCWGHFEATVSISKLLLINSFIPFNEDRN